MQRKSLNLYLSSYYFKLLMLICFFPYLVDPEQLCLSARSKCLFPTDTMEGLYAMRILRIHKPYTTTKSDHLQLHTKTIQNHAHPEPQPLLPPNEQIVWFVWSIQVAFSWHTPTLSILIIIVRKRSVNSCAAVFDVVRA